MNKPLPTIRNLTKVIFHKNCSDGYAAAYVAKRRFPDVELVPCMHRTTPPDVTGHDVLIADFSYPREDLVFLEVHANSLTVLDHHKSAEEDLKGLPFCYFDMHRSGAGLTWDCLFPGEPRPAVVNYVEDHDLWKHKLHASRAVNAVISSYAFGMRDWDDLHARFAQESLDAIAHEGGAILRSQARIIERAVDSSYKVDFCGYKGVPVTCSSALQSEVGHELAKKAPFSASWSVNSSGGFRVSLRSRPNGADVAAIAAEFGGGGHEHSAAFTVPWDEGIELFAKRRDSSCEERL